MECMKHLQVLCFSEVSSCRQALSRQIMPCQPLVGAMKQFFSQPLVWMWSVEEHLNLRRPQTSRRAFVCSRSTEQDVKVCCIGATGTISLKISEPALT